MAIYVDHTFDWPGPRGHKKWCHMGTDDHSHEGIEALHAFAAKIGMKREWYQDETDHKHYDLVPSKRALAVKLGAVECPSTLAYSRICGRKAYLRNVIRLYGPDAAIASVEGRAELVEKHPERRQLFLDWALKDDEGYQD